MNEKSMETTIQPVNPGTFTVPGDADTPSELLGGYCRACRKLYYPRPQYCPSCLEAVESRKVGGRGTVHSFTVVRTKPPLGLPQPYCVGYVDLDASGLRVFGLLDPDRVEDVELGTRVRLTVRSMGHDGRGAARLRPCFTPDQHTGGEEP